MEFGRKISFPETKVKLYFRARNVVSKQLLTIVSFGSVKIYDKDPKSNKNLTPVATLTPTHLSQGTLFLIWDVPSDLKPGIYYDSWEDLIFDNNPSPGKVVQKFFVSEKDSLSHENFLNIPRDISINTNRVYVGSKEYIIFKQNTPELPFPEVHVRVVATAEVESSVKLVRRDTGPGINTEYASNALFPKEPVLTIVQSIPQATAFEPIPTFDQEAYFLFDTEGLKENSYSFQLKLIEGETETLTSYFTVDVREPLR